MRDDVRNFLKQTEKIVKELGSKAGDLAKAIEKDAAYGTKVGMVKVEQLALENEKNKLINQFGGKAYALARKKVISHNSLNELLEKIKDVENKIKGKKLVFSNLKRKFRKKKQQ